MSVARITEITATSKESFEDALKQGIARATQTLDNVQGVWIKDQSVVLNNGKIDSFKVDMKVTFVLNS